MGNIANKQEPPPPPPPPPMILVPPLFDLPPLSARTRMLESSYNMLFRKPAMRCLFEDYFEPANCFSTKFLLKPCDDPRVDVLASVIRRNHWKEPEGKIQFRWQSDLNDPHTFLDFSMSNSDPALVMRSCAYNPKFGLGAFGIFPLILKKRYIQSSDELGAVGLRYGSTNLSLGATFTSFTTSPKTAWLVSKMGRITAGVQYEPLHPHDVPNFKDLKNWSCAVGYAVGPSSPIYPSFSVEFELARGSQLITSFYQHVVIQRPLEDLSDEKGIAVEMTSYIDFGFELQTRVDADTSNNLQESTGQVAASWQVNKNFLLKGKVGPRSSTVALAFKAWWKPSWTFNIAATTDHSTGKTSCGFGIRVENLRETSQGIVYPYYVMATQNKDHMADRIAREMGERFMFQSDVDAENFDGLPQDLRPLGTFF